MERIALQAASLGRTTVLQLRIKSRSEENIMQYLRSSRAWVLFTLLTALFLTTVLARASGGRDFSGYFDVSAVQQQGELVQVTLHLKLFNHTDVDAKSVIVTLVDSAPTMTLRGNFQPVKVWKSQQFIQMSQEFTVTQREFREWMTAPGQPNVVILFQDANGRSWQKGAQLSQRPLLREEMIRAETAGEETAR
jgi:hypothetical protein